jgi:hypothetical protein
MFPEIGSELQKKGSTMNISAIGSGTNPNMQGTASGGGNASVDAQGSATAQLLQQQNGGNSTSGSSGSQSSSNSILTKLRTYANQNMPVSEIAQLLGQSVSTVMLEASQAGINLNSGNSSSTAGANPNVGNNVNTTA